MPAGPFGRLRRLTDEGNAPAAAAIRRCLGDPVVALDEARKCRAAPGRRQACGDVNPRRDQLGSLENVNATSQARVPRQGAGDHCAVTWRDHERLKARTEVRAATGDQGLFGVRGYVNRGIADPQRVGERAAGGIRRRGSERGGDQAAERFIRAASLPCLP